MLKPLATLLICFCLLACDNTDDNNAFLPNVAVNQIVYLNNPTSANLRIPGGYIKVGGGLSGILVYNQNNNQFLAYELACPTHAVTECTPMQVNDGITMECPCDNLKFAMALGGRPQNGAKFSAKQYRVEKNGETLVITNY